MPIIPRFASVQDPNTPPNVDFSQGIMQSALAGAQLRRMGVEEKQAEAESKRADARLGMQQDTLAFRKQAYQDSRDAQSEQAAVTGFFSGQSGLPADQAGPPSPFEAQELEARGAQAFRGSLKTPEAQRLFDEQYAGYLENRRQEIRSQRLQADLQDTLLGASEMPGAKPFMPELERLGSILDEVTNPALDPKTRVEAMGKWSQDFSKVQQDIIKEQTRMENFAAATAQFDELISGYPIGHPTREALQFAKGSMFMSRDPAKGAEALAAIQRGEVWDGATGGYVKPEVKIKADIDRQRLGAIASRAASEVASGNEPRWADITDYAKALYESQYYKDKETGQPVPVNPGAIPLTLEDCHTLALAKMSPQRVAKMLAGAAGGDMDAAIDQEGSVTPTSSQGGATPTAQGGTTPTPSTPPAPKMEPITDLESKLARWKRAGIVPDDQVAALEQEIAGRKSKEEAGSKLSKKYGSENTVLLEIRRRKAERSGAPEAQEIKSYIESDATARGEELRRLMGLDAAALSDMLDSAESSERMGAIKERRGYSGTRG